jgi:hypothetical protein
MAKSKTPRRLFSSGVSPHMPLTKEGIKIVKEVQDMLLPLLIKYKNADNRDLETIMNMAVSGAMLVFRLQAMSKSINRKKD